MKFTHHLRRQLADGQEVKTWLHPHQRAVLPWAMHKRGVLLRWPTGAGKTVAGCILACRPAPSDRLVVVCRSDAKTTVWKRTLDRLTHRQSTIAWSQTPHLPREADTVIINWEILKYWREELESWLGEGTLILDEAHYASSWRRTKKVIDPLTKRPRKVPLDTRSVATYLLSRRCRWVIALTATPVANNRMDFWNILDILQPGGWGNSFQFAHFYCAATPGEFGGLDTSGHSNSKRFRQKLAEVMHSVEKEDIAGIYNDMRREIIFLDPAELNRPGAYAKELRASRGKDHAWLRLARASSRKHKWAAQRVAWHHEEGDRIVVAFGIRKECEKFGAAMVKKYGDAVRWSHGGVPARERERQLEWYTSDAPGPRILVVTLQAWGQSIDGLQISDAAYTLHLPWTPLDLIQWDGRFQRGGGAGKACTMYYVIAPGTYDERVQEVVLSKMEIVLATYSDTDSAALQDLLDTVGDEDQILADILSGFEEED